MQANLYEMLVEERKAQDELFIYPSSPEYDAIMALCSRHRYFTYYVNSLISQPSGSPNNLLSYIERRKKQENPLERKRNASEST